MADKESKMIQWYSDAKIQCKSDAWVFWEKIKQDPGIDSYIPLGKRSLCNIWDRELLIGNPRTRASNKIIMIQRLARQNQYS